MQAGTFKRDLTAEAAKHADDGSTAEERVQRALELGELCLDVYLGSLPPGTTRDEARQRAERLKSHGRRRSMRRTT